MQIYPKGSGPVLPDPTQAPQAVLNIDPVSPVAPAPASVDRSDKVSISDAGRALAARDGEGESVDPARASQIRERVLSGAYDTLEVVDAVARRLLDTGDL
jgi:hypothetical protein